MIKKLIALATTVTVILAVAAACTKKPKVNTEDYTLKLGYSGSLCEAPLHIAVEKGFFDDEKLKVELIKLAPGTAFEAVTANKVEAGFGLLASLIQPLSNGLPIKITSGLHTGCDKVLVPKDSSIKSVKDLKGKKIGVSSLTSSPAIYAKRVLADAGIGVSTEKMEVEFIVFSANDLPLALKNGSVDALAMNDPTASISKKEYDLNTIADSALDAPYKDQYCCSAYVRDNIAADYPEVAAKYTRAMQKASAWIQKNPDETTKIQVDKKWVAGDAAFNATILKTYNFIPSVSGAYNAFGTTAKQLQQVGMLDKSVDVEALHKKSFVTLKDVPDEVKASDVKK
jgi:NitT/TauT family transport system substrate-binding protein